MFGFVSLTCDLIISHIKKLSIHRLRRRKRTFLPLKVGFSLKFRRKFSSDSENWYIYIITPFFPIQKVLKTFLFRGISPMMKKAKRNLAKKLRIFPKKNRRQNPIF